MRHPPFPTSINSIELGNKDRTLTSMRSPSKYVTPMDRRGSASSASTSALGRPLSITTAATLLLPWSSWKNSVKKGTMPQLPLMDDPAPGKEGGRPTGRRLWRGGVGDVGVRGGNVTHEVCKAYGGKQCEGGGRLGEEDPVGTP